MASKKSLSVKSKDSANEIDSLVGARLRARRADVGMSQEKLAEQSGITFQQIQKYETGKNRISASRLVQFATILSVPIAYFFETVAQTGLQGLSEGDQDGYEAQTSKETAELIQTYYSVRDEKTRKKLMKLIKDAVRDLGKTPQK